MKIILLVCLMAISAYSTAGPRNGTCYLDHGVFFCTGASEKIASNACEVGTGFLPSGCSSEPDGLVGCQCDKRPDDKGVTEKPFNTVFKAKK